MVRIKDLEAAHFDYLKEMTNIGASHGATALSQLMNRKIKLNVPDIQVISISKFKDLYGETLVASNYTYISGELSGHFFIFFSPEEAERLIQYFVDDSDLLNNEMAQSVFNEVGNILCGSYLTALSAFIGHPLNQAPHQVSMDMAGAILSEGLLELSLYEDDVLLIETLLSEEGQNLPIHAEIIFLPEPDMLEKLFINMETT